jgi:class 3 adenylate cyclase
VPGESQWTSYANAYFAQQREFYARRASRESAEHGMSSNDASGDLERAWREAPQAASQAASQGVSPSAEIKGRSELGALGSSISRRRRQMFAGALGSMVDSFSCSNVEEEEFWRTYHVFRSLLLGLLTLCCTLTALSIVGPGLYSGCSDSHLLLIFSGLIGLPLLAWHVNWLCHRARCPMLLSKLALAAPLLLFYSAIVIYDSGTHAMEDQADEPYKSTRPGKTSATHPDPTSACKFTIHTLSHHQSYLMELVDYLFCFIWIACLLRSWPSRTFFILCRSFLWAVDNMTYMSYSSDLVPRSQRAWNWAMWLAGESGLVGTALVIAVALEHAQDAQIKRHVEKALLQQRVSVLEQEKEQLLWAARRAHSQRSRDFKILHELFPRDAVDELLRTGGASAKVHPKATLLFADLVGFTSWASRQTPDRIFEALGPYYQLLDSYCDDLGGYKIETVGDCYVASFDIFESRTSGVLGAIEMGLRIVEKSVAVLRKLCEDESISVRVGVHTGSFCSGIMKSTRPRWQLFGDTINVASRMESTGQPDAVHISEATLAAIIEAHTNGTRSTETETLEMTVDRPQDVRPLRFRDLVFSPVTSEVKGKGTLQTYYVERCEDSGHDQYAWQPQKLPSEDSLRDPLDDEATPTTPHLKNARMAERALLNGGIGGARFSRIGSGQGEATRVVLIATKQSHDLLPICHRFNSIASPAMAKLKCICVTDANDAYRRMCECDVAIIIYHLAVLDSEQSGERLRTLLTNPPTGTGGTGGATQILMVDSDLALDVLSDAEVRAEIKMRYPDAPSQFFQVVQRAEQIDVAGAIESMEHLARPPT